MSEPVLTSNQHGPLAGSTSVESSVWTKGFSSEELKAVVSFLSEGPEVSSFSIQSSFSVEG